MSATTIAVVYIEETRIDKEVMIDVWQEAGHIHTDVRGLDPYKAYGGAYRCHAFTDDRIRAVFQDTVNDDHEIQLQCIEALRDAGEPVEDAA